MRRVLLDTSAYTRLMTGEASVLNALAGAQTVYLSVFVLGELFAGFRGGKRFRDNKDILARFLAKPTVQFLLATRETAEVFGAVKAALRAAGTPIPTNDVWIASHALETGSTLVTFDGHFNRVAGVRLWDEAT